MKPTAKNQILTGSASSPDSAPWTGASPLCAALIGLAFALSSSMAYGAEVVRLIIDGAVDEIALQGMRRRLDQAIAEGAKTIVFQIDSEARADPHARIAEAGDAIYQARVGGVKTIAWIPMRANGWGAVLALACGEIYMGVSARIGNATPEASGLVFSPDDMTRPGSTLSSVTTAIANWSDGGTLYPIALGQAMVDPSLEVSQVLTTRGVEYWTAQDVTNPPREIRSLQRVIVAQNTVLELETQDALKYELARRDYRSIDDLYTDLGLKDAVTLEPNAFDYLARIVTSVWMTILLIALGVIGIVVELKSPGLGIGGAIAVIAFGLLFIGHNLGGQAEGWEILLFIAGIILLLVEVFLIPGFGVAGFLGIACFFASLFLVTMPDSGQWSFGDETFVRSLLMLLMGLIIPIVVTATLLRFLPNAPIFGRIVHKESLPQPSAYVDAAGREVNSLVGQRGVATTMLRPAGKVAVAGEEYDAASFGDMIESGKAVVVEKVQGMQLLVRAVDSDNAT